MSQNLEPDRPIINVKMRDNYAFICPYIYDGRCALEGYHGNCIIEKPFLMKRSYGLIAGNLRSCKRIEVEAVA